MLNMVEQKVTIEIISFVSIWVFLIIHNYTMFTFVQTASLGFQQSKGVYGAHVMK